MMLCFQMLPTESVDGSVVVVSVLGSGSRG